MFFEEVVYANELRHVHPGEKILFVAWVMSVAFLTEWPIQLVVLGVTVGVLCGVARVPLRVYARILLAPLLFLALGVAVIVYSEKSFTEGIGLFFRSLTVFSGLSFLFLTTPMVDLLLFLRRFRVSPLFIELAFLTYRYIFLLMEFVESIQLAQNARLGYGSFRQRLYSLALLVSALFLWIVQAIEEIQIELSARGYEGGGITFLEGERYLLHYGRFALLLALHGVWIGSLFLARRGVP